MVLFILLLVMLIIIGIILALAITVGGAFATVLFSDVIVCAFIIAWIMKKIIDKKK